MVILSSPASWSPTPRTPAPSPGPLSRPGCPKAQCACVFLSSRWSRPCHALISHHFRKHSLGDCFLGARPLPPGLRGSPRRPVHAFLRCRLWFCRVLPAVISERRAASLECLAARCLRPQSRFQQPCARSYCCRYAPGLSTCRSPFISVSKQN